MKEKTLGGAIIHYVNGDKEEIMFLRDDESPEGPHMLSLHSCRYHKTLCLSFSG
jgi:hypothetical protein